MNKRNSSILPPRGAANPRSIIGLNMTKDDSLMMNV